MRMLMVHGIPLSHGIPRPGSGTMLVLRNSGSRHHVFSGVLGVYSFT